MFSKNITKPLRILNGFTTFALRNKLKTRKPTRPILHWEGWIKIWIIKKWKN